MFGPRPLGLLVAAVGASLALCSPADAAAGPAGCDRVASPAPGAAQRLADSLTASQTGCLRTGTYVEDVKVTRGGRPGQPVTIRNFPGEKATLKGRLWVAKGADSVTFEQLHLNGSNRAGLPSPNVNAQDTVFRNNDVTNDHTAICFNLGASSYDNNPIYGRAVRTVIDSNRIHHCGRLPATNHDHGIYIEASDDARITNNWIYENADRGIQIYPDSRNTTIDHNVIDRNGQGIIFGGDGGLASRDNTVTNNAITNSKLRNNIESWWNPDGPTGTNNTATNNCIKGGTRDNGNGGIDTSDGGFTITNTTIAAPRYNNTANHDYRIPTGPCAAVIGIQAADRMAGVTTDGGPPPGDVSVPAEDPVPGPTPTTPVKPAPTPTPSRPGRPAAPKPPARPVSPRRPARSLITIRLKLKLARGGKKVRRVNVKGQVKGRSAAGTRALLQAKKGRRWVTVGRALVTKAGSFKAVIKVPAAASIRIRAKVAGVTAQAAVKRV